MVLNLEELRTGVMGLTPEFGSFCLQACTVCLEGNMHNSGIHVSLDGHINQSMKLNWSNTVTEQAKRNFKDQDEAVEYGATAIAILLSREFSSQDCIERSSKGTGFDYYLGEEDSFGVFQKKARLEISGIFKETKANNLQKRTARKGKQTEKSDALNLDAHICVMEFSNPKCAYSIISK